MAKRHRHLLSPLDVMRAKPRVKPYRLADGGGLHLWVPPSGVKSWQLRYRLNGKPQTYTLGRCSDVQGLAWARTEADKARARADEGEHLTRAKAVKKARRAAAAANTFAAVSDDWLKSEARRAPWLPRHRDQVKASLDNHLSELAALPVAEISAAIAAPLLRRVERAAPDMSKKIRQRLRAILDHAVESGIIPVNPIPAPKRRRKAEGRARLPATLTKDGVGAILRAADKSEGSKGVLRAHLLCTFTAQRIGEIVPARWDEIDFDRALWTIPRDRMKRRDVERGPHEVPLPPRLFEQMREWRRVDGEGAEFICGAPRSNTYVTREAVEKFYRRSLGLAGKHSPHSWRSVLSTWAADAGQDADAVEAQLDHNTGTKVQTAYDRSKRLERRAELMKWHEGALLASRDGAPVINLRTRRESAS